MTHAIAVENIMKTYRSKGSGGVHALAGVSLTIPQGQIFGLLGPNGAGKSTLVKILSTMTPPTSGRATVAGHDVAREPLSVRRQLAVVLQQTAAETMLTVRDNLLIYAYLHGIGRGEAQRRVARIAEEFELTERLRDTVQDLSIGTKRRIQVAKIFLLDTPVLILDEATTGMDPFMKRRVLERLRNEARKGRTVMLTTQVLSEAEELCDTIMIIDRGRSMASGTLDELRHRSATTFRVVLSFESVNEPLLQRLKVLEPAELEVNGGLVQMVFRGEETALLERLAEISRTHPILQFEIRRASLEDIFVSLVEEAR
jgi:ABC-2 type transport system ATP-binding protein